MTIRHLGAVSVVALVTACSPHQSAQQSPTQAAYAAYVSGDYRSAEQGYAAILASDPGNPSALLGMGEVMEATNRGSEALGYYRRAVAARNGAIRVHNGRQDGVTEVAYRRLGALGSHGTSYAQSAPAPSPYAEFQAPPMYVEPGNTYTQPSYSTLPSQVAAYPQAGTVAPLHDTGYDAPAISVGGQQTILQSESIEYMPAPVQYTSASIQYQAEPVQHYTPAPVAYQPAPIQYETAPIQYQPAPVQYQPAPVQYQPAPVQYQPAPVEYAPAAIEYAPAPAQYAPAPATTLPYGAAFDVYSAAPAPVETYTAAPQQTPVPQPYRPAPAGYEQWEPPRGYEYAPITSQNSDPMARRPMPKPTRTVLTTPDYTIVNGVVEYVKDPATATVAIPVNSSVNYETMPVQIGTPIEVISSGIPVGTPGSYSAPRGIDVSPSVYGDTVIELRN